MVREELILLGSKIREIRLSKKLSLNQLADKCDFEKANLARIEKGNTNPTYITLSKIAKALSVSVRDLVDI